MVGMIILQLTSKGINGRFINGINFPGFSISAILGNILFYVNWFDTAWYNNTLDVLEIQFTYYISIGVIFTLICTCLVASQDCLAVKACAEKKVLEDYKKKAELSKNPEEIKKLAVQEVRKEAINHFAGKEEILKQAMGQMETFKLKYPDAATMHDITKRVYNQMHGKPIIERIVPAFSLQILSKGDLLIDINPRVGYRLSGKWTAGVGWVERFQFHSINTVIPEGRIFGPRAFTDIKWKKGFGFRVEVEYINLYVSPTNAGDGNTRPWVWGVLAGIKKDYKIAKGVNGNIQILYKVDSPWFFLNPYADRFNIRIGLEFPLREVRTKKEG